MDRLKNRITVLILLLFCAVSVFGCSDTQQRGPLDVRKVTYVVWSGDVCHVDVYVFTPDFKVKHYSINPESDKNYDYPSGELPPEDRYEIEETEISEVDWSSIVNILTRVGFMELVEELPFPEDTDDAPSYCIRVETADDMHTSGGYAAGYGEDSDNRRFAEARDMMERIINRQF
ncbi:hypothetical protein SAMN02910456_00602 [Ruminococcaceae bacterium YRB3002]|nr:hypothetical protein SAMN02910456_00602 [Ruminococcaceae bacterium YRB3002]